MCTWAIVFLANKGVMVPESYLPFFIAMGIDCAMVYYLASGIAGKVL